jgi:mono/diheme cytochrome c family protein
VGLGLQLRRPSPRHTQIPVSDGSQFQPFSTYRIDIEHFRVDEIDGNTLIVTRSVDGTVVQDHPAGEPIDRIFNGTDVAPDDRGELTDTVGPDGATVTANVPIVTVPVGKTVRFNISSQDVIHSFYVPQFLYKLDAVPGRTQALWLKVTDAGFYQGQCAEFCGREHARMLFSVRALDQDDYDDWFQAKRSGASAQISQEPAEQSSDDESTTGAAGSDVAAGQQAFFNNGCNICHGDTGQGGIGPTIAQTGFTVEQVLGQYRNPRGVMPRFDASAVPDDTVASIHAWLQTLPLPDSIVPGQGTP